MCAECKKNGARRYFRATYKDYGDFSKMPLQVVTEGSFKKKIKLFCVCDNYIVVVT